MTNQRGNAIPRKYANFDDYLTQHGVKEEIDIAVEKKIISMQVQAALKERNLNKSEFARQLGTSRVQVDRILDPYEQNISLTTLKKVAQALGKRLHFSFVDL
jgi:antitoxin HicB